MKPFRRATAAVAAALIPLGLAVAVAAPAHAATPAVAADIHVNEVESNGDAVGDWIELSNTGGQDEDLTGWWLADNAAGDHFVIPDGTVIPAGGYASFIVDHNSDGTSNSTAPGHFGLGAADSAMVYDASSTLVDGISWTAHASGTYSRCAYDAAGHSAFVDTTPSTRNAANTCPSQASVAATLASQVRVNEAGAEGTPADPDWIELTNTGKVTAEVGGFHLTDSKGIAGGDDIVIPAGTVIAPGAFQTTHVDTGVTGAFGLGAVGKADAATAILPDGTTTVDSIDWGTGSTSGLQWVTGESIGRCPDGTGAFRNTFTATENTANSCANPADAKIKVNEVDVAGGKVELTNTGTTTYDVSGWLIKDQAGTTYTIPASSTIAPGAFAAYAVSGAFTLGSTDSVSVLDGTASVDGYSWSSAPTTSYGRCPDGTGSFTQTSAVTDGAANSCPASGGGLSDIRINEIETNGDTAGDWVELTNIGAQPVDVSGVVFRDNDDAHGYTIPAGTTIQPGGFYKLSVTDFVFGLGAPDQARIFAPGGTTLLDSTSWSLHEAGLTYDRCPGATQGVVFTDTADSTPFITSFTSTPNAANDCRAPIRINEVQASDPTSGPDWIELTNVGNLPVDISGMQLADDKDTDIQTIPSGTTLQPGSFYAVDSTAGLGATGDEVRLFAAGANTGGVYDSSKLIDSFVWEAPKQAYLTQTVTLTGGAWPTNATYGRCPDGTGGWHVTTAAAGGVSPGTRGASNTCPGILTPQAWPGPQAVTTADNVDFGQNMSGLFYVPGATPSADYMWGIENGDSGLATSVGQSALFKLVRDANGNWGPAAGWENGKAVHYADGNGQPDSEGVTAVGGKVYTATERDNDNDTVSKVAVLEYDPASGSSLTATREWDLQADLAADPGLKSPDDANLGAEGLTYVPDSYLTAAGFKTDAGTAYDPSAYGDHLGGLFFVALEKTGKLYAYALKADGSYSRVAVVDTGFPTIMDVSWDPSQDALWTDCDNSCQGQTSIIKLDTDAASATYGHFEPTTIYNRPTGATDNLNNEGFAFQPATECVDGEKSVWWADDSDDGGHALRTAQVDCTPLADNHVGSSITAELSSTATPNGDAYAAPVTVTFTCTTTDAVLVTPCPAPVTLSEDGDGQTATGTITDTLGRTTSVTSAPVDIDTVAPTVSIDTQPAFWVAPGVQSVAFHSSEPAATLECRVDAAAYSSCGSPFQPTITTAGTHTIDLRATDAAGNTSTVQTVTVDVDATAPAVSIGGVRAGATYDGVGPTPTCHATDADSGVGGCTLAITRTPTSVKVVAHALDNVGNTASRTVSYRTRAVSLLGLTPSASGWKVRSGKAYTLEVLSTSARAPRYLAPVKGTPKGSGKAMHSAGVVNGVHVWKLSVRFHLGSGTYRLGVKQGSKLTVLKVRR